MKKPSRHLPINKLIPNIVTISALCLGIWALHSAMIGKWDKACFLIICAAVFDALDGRLARMLNAKSNFGANLDSLCDFANFGIFPAMIMYHWTLDKSDILGWSVVMVSAICAASRLARFNSQINIVPHPVKKQFFEGVPSPAAGILILLPLIISSGFDISHIMRQPRFYVYEIYIVIISLAMVTTMPTISLKYIKIPKQQAGIMLVLIGLVIVSLIVFKLKAIGFYAAIYLILMPFTVLKYCKMMKLFKIKPESFQH
jgi:CDP-diacylglycerol--serine O-phosphatidyltransferase